MKKCSKCKTKKGLGEFYNDITKKDGLEVCCKACKAAYRLRKKLERNAGNYCKWPRTSKTCSTCKLDKQLSEFCTDHRTKSGLSSRCRGCNSVRLRNWRANNPEYSQEYNLKKRGVRAAYDKGYSSRPDVKARKNAQKRKRRREDPIFRLNNNLKRRFLDTLGLVGDNKLSKTAFYKHHLSSLIRLFDDPLAEEWIAGGEIHVDHLFPVAQIENPILGKYLESIGVDDTMDNRIMYVHSPANMRFMTAEENMAKRDSLDEWAAFVGINL